MCVDCIVQNCVGMNGRERKVAHTALHAVCDEATEGIGLEGIGGRTGRMHCDTNTTLSVAERVSIKSKMTGLGRESGRADKERIQLVIGPRPITVLLKKKKPHVLNLTLRAQDAQLTDASALISAGRIRDAGFVRWPYTMEGKCDLDMCAAVLVTKGSRREVELFQITNLMNAIAIWRGEAIKFSTPNLGEWNVEHPVPVDFLKRLVRHVQGNSALKQRPVQNDLSVICKSFRHAFEAMASANRFEPYGFRVNQGRETITIRPPSSTEMVAGMFNRSPPGFLVLDHSKLGRCNVSGTTLNSTITRMIKTFAPQ